MLTTHIHPHQSKKSKCYLCDPLRDCEQLQSGISPQTFGGLRRTLLANRVIPIPVKHETADKIRLCPYKTPLLVATSFLTPQVFERGQRSLEAFVVDVRNALRFYTIKMSYL